ALDAIAEHLELRPHHGGSFGEYEHELPSRLDPTLTTWDAFTEHCRKIYRLDLACFTPAGIRRLVAADASALDRAAVLEHLDLADLPGVLDLVVADLADRTTPGFGSRTIHAGLTREQLETIARRQPSVLKEDRFVRAMVQRLAPATHVVVDRDPAARSAWLARLSDFVAGLPPTHSDLVAHVYYHRLADDRRHGRYRSANLLAYLAIPRRVAYARASWIERHGHHAVRLDADFADVTGLSPIGDDTALVRAYLLHLLRDAEDPQAYAAYLDHDWLERVFVESKVLHGVGDTAAWFSRLDDPQWFQDLRQRVDIGFAADNPERFAADAPVALAVELKNVDRLLVRTFIIDPLACYREHDAPIDLRIDLDGLVANHEQTIVLDVPPLRRVRREITLPDLGSRAVAVVEIIGNGRRARALVRKGTLRVRERIGAAGHACTVHDAAGHRLTGGRIHLGTRSFAADSEGLIRIPFAASPGTKTILIEHDGFAVRERLDHRAEQYALRAGFHVERESLLPDTTAPILIRPRLLVHGEPIDLTVLDEARLTVTADLAGGLTTTLVDTRVDLVHDRELTHSISVPADLRRLHCRLTAKLTRLSDGERVRLDDQRSFARATLASTHHIAAAHLRRTRTGFTIVCRGHNGEPLAGQTLQLALQHHLVTRALHVSLRSDAAGRIELGPLDGIRHLMATFPDDDRSYSWTIAGHAPAPTAPIHLVAGTPLRIPDPDTGPPERERVGLVELRGTAVYADRFAALEREPGFLVARGLAPGDYRYHDHRSGSSRRVAVRAGQLEAQTILAADANYERSPTTPLQITRASLDGATVEAQLAGAGPTTRVHVLATRYWPRINAVRSLDLPTTPPRSRVFRVLPGAYADSVDLGRELRYILARRTAAKFPGVMLERPSLLLNPWQLPEPATASDATGAEQSWMGRGAGGGARGATGRYGGGAGRRRAYAGDPVLAFLPHPALVVTNCAVAADGSVRVTDPRFEDAGLVRVVAIDRSRCIQVALPGADRDLTPRDRRTTHALSTAHFQPQRRLLALARGEQVSLAAGDHSAFALIDSLGALHTHLQDLVEDQRLADFRFLTRWNELDAQQKLAHYDEHACHELHLFIARRDPDFFARFIKPHLADKRDPTLIDRYLLDQPLDAFLAPQRYRRCNQLERALLAQAFPDERPGIARSMAERLALDPRPSRRFDLVFTTALHGRGRVATTTGANLVPQKTDAPPPSPPAAVTRERVSEGEALRRDAEARAQQRGFYRGAGPTRILVESNYYRVPPEQAHARLLPVHQLWHDLASAEQRPFVSVGALFADGSLNAALAALALCDLPFIAPEHAIVRDGATLRITAAGPLLLAAREVEPLAQAPAQRPVLLAQNAYPVAERHRHENGERVDNFISDEFLTHTPYATEVLLSNPTSQRRRLDVLALLPDGSMPLADATARNGRHLVLEPYATERFALGFYFPRPGDYAMPGAHASQARKLVAWADPFTYTVVDEPTRVDTTSWSWVARHAEPAAVLAHLEQANLRSIDLERIAWRMEDRDFFTRTLALLDRRRVYVPALWLHAFHHHDAQRAAEYLAQHEDFMRRCGPYLDSPLLTIDPVARGLYTHREFAPLINPRQHQVGERARIANQAVAEQYTTLLDILARKPALDAADNLALTYHLLLQDRIAAAHQRFARVERSEVTGTVPYDYCAAYIAMTRGDVGAARRLAQAHATHPIPRWRERFRAVLAQLDTLEGEAIVPGDPRDPIQVHDALAESEPQLGLARAGERLALEWRGMEKIDLRFFFMDVELLFTRDPFLDANDGATAVAIAPNHSRTIALPQPIGRMEVALSAAVANRNLLIEAVGAGKRRSLSLYNNAMDVAFVEAYGQVAVSDRTTGAPLDTVYVKVYRRDPAGEVHFHKDGYTDLRGRFDYVTINELTLDDVAAFAVLVLSEDHGAVVEQVEPPAQ
ncbi:MAG: hypothetical protein ACOCYV_01185, partial [Planctomycetota bacterium]